MNTYDLIMKDIKDTIRKYMEYKIIYNPMFAEKKCTEFCISSNHNQTGIQKDIGFVLMGVRDLFREIVGD